jgi:hypothetical protein
MTEALKTITPEELEALRWLASEDELKRFFFQLNYNFGDGEVLNYKQIESFFKNKIHKKTEEDMLTLFVDTIRMLHLVGRNKDEILGLDSDGVIFLHDELSDDYAGEVDDLKKVEYEKSVAPFVDLSGDYDDIKVELIATLDELNKEGSSMNHCIASYHDIIINKHYIGFRIFNKKTNERLTLGCQRLDNKLYFNQLKGWGNNQARKDSCISVIDFCNSKKIMIPQGDVYDLMPAFL